MSRQIKIYLLRVGHERDGGERNDRNGERKDRETPRGQKNGGRAWWSREAARARSQQDALEGGSTHGVGWLRPTLNLLLMVKKNQGWRSVCLGRESGAPVRNAGAAAVAGSGGGVTMKVWGQCTIVRPERGERG